MNEQEKWVGLDKLAEHLGLSYQRTRLRVIDGTIPGCIPIRCGKRTQWRCKLSQVDAELQSKTA